MAAKLSFRINPPIAYHTYDYHYNKCLQTGFIGLPEELPAFSDRIADAATQLALMLDILPEYYFFFLKDPALIHKFIDEMTGGPGNTGLDLGITGNYTVEFQTNPLKLNIDPDFLPQAFDHYRSLSIYRDIDLRTGRKFNPNSGLRSSNPEPTVFVHSDVSFSIPSESFASYMHYVQSFAFSTRYGIGMKEPLYVWIIKKDIVESAIGETWDLIRKENGIIKQDSYPETDSEHIYKLPGAYRTTLNSVLTEDRRKVFSDAGVNEICIFGKILRDMHNRGIQVIRNEIKYKALVFENAVKESTEFELLISDPEFRSRNIICARTSADIERVEKYFYSKGLEPDMYKSDEGDTILRIANYPAHSKEQVEYLADMVMRF